MTRADAIQALPCYVSGDLDSDGQSQIRHWIRKDDDVAALAKDLVLTREAVQAALDLSAPDGLLDLVQQKPAARSEVSPYRRWILVAAAVLTLMLPLALLVSWQSQTHPDAYVEAHAVVSAPGAWIHPGDAQALATAFAHNDVPQALQVVPSLTHIGLTTVGVVILPGDPSGSAVIYEDAEGHLYTCQMWTGTQLPALSERGTAGGMPVRYARKDGVSMVAYTINGMICITTSDRPVQELVALIDRRLTARR